MNSGTLNGNDTNVTVNGTNVTVNDTNVTVNDTSTMPGAMAEPLPRPPQHRFWAWPRREAQEGDGSSWYSPPADQATGEIVNAMAGQMDGRHFEQAQLLRLGRAQADKAVEELEAVDSDAAQALERRNAIIARQNAALDEQVEHKQTSLQQERVDLERRREEEVEASARAGALGRTPAERWASLTTPPSKTAFAARAGFTYLPDALPVLAWINDWAALLVGPVLGLCLYTLMGLLEVSDLDRPLDSLLRLFLMVLTGTAILLLAGGLITCGTRIVGHWIHDQQAGSLAPRRKRLLVASILGSCLLATVLIAAAEIVVDGYALRLLDQQRQIAQSHSAGQAFDAAASPLPLWASVLVAVLVSVPFLSFKAAWAYHGVQRRVRENYLRHCHEAWLERRSQEEPVQAAAIAWDALARQEARVQQTEREIAELKSRRQPLRFEYDEDTRARLRAARLAALGESALLHRRCEDVAAALGPLPKPVPEPPSF